MPKNLGVDTFPDPVGHFGPPWQPFWILQAVWHCRQWASAPFATRLVFVTFFYGSQCKVQQHTVSIQGRYISYNIPSISQIVSRHWRTMRQDPYLSQVFSQPALVAYKRPENLRDKLIRAKVPEIPPPRLRRIVNGMRKYNDCPICPFVKTGQIVKSVQSNLKVEIQRSVKCQT